MHPATRNQVVRAGLLTVLLIARPSQARPDDLGDPPRGNPPELRRPTAWVSPQHDVPRDLRHMASRRTLGLLLAGAVLAGASTAIEDPDQMERVLGNGAVGEGADLGNLYGSAFVLGLGAASLTAGGQLGGDPELRDLGSSMARSLFYTGVVVWSLKIAVGRRRPNGGSHSFPSGHTAAAFAVAPIFAQRLGPRAALPAYALAIGTALGRMEERKHYLSDVVFGAAVGLSIGAAVAGSDGGPEVTLDTRGVGLTIRF